MATEAHRAPGAWLDAVEQLGSGEKPRDILGAGDQATEYLLMAMRLAEGLSMARYEALAGRPVDEAALARLQDWNMVRRADGHVMATREGRPVLNAILRELAA